MRPALLSPVAWRDFLSMLSFLDKPSRAIRAAADLSDAYSFAAFPNAGLANKLFVWARASCFAHLNQIPILCSSWGVVHWGSLFRRDQRARFYGKTFTGSSALDPLRRSFVVASYARVHASNVARLERPRSIPTLYVFSGYPATEDYFEQIREHRDLLRESLVRIVRSRHRARLKSMIPPVIAVHVRAGDFRPLRDGEEFGRWGHVRAPLSYYLDLINGVRALAGTCLPVTIFSDSSEGVVRSLLSLENTSMAERSPDIVDLLQLSRSKVLITSPSSTFSYWAGFLSDAVVLTHPTLYKAALRPETVDVRRFQGGALGSHQTWPAELASAVDTEFARSGAVKEPRDWFLRTAASLASAQSND